MTHHRLHRRAQSVLRCRPFVEYARHTVGSRNPLKRWLHEARFATSLKLLRVQPHDRVLDYGCGDGELAHRISRTSPTSDILAFDPAEELYSQAERRLAGDKNVRVVHSLGRVSGQFERIACLETVEHLPPQELATALRNIDALLAAGGLCLFTFPIEHGMMSLVKNCYRLATQRDKYASLSRTARALLGLPIPREPSASLSGCRYIYSHIGFNCRDMVTEISRHFVIKDSRVLPVGTVAFGMGNGLAVIVGKR